jgi:putative tricarboxylic transport membrane protein
MSDHDDGANAPRGFVKSPEDLAGGLLLIVFAALLYSQAMGLRFGQLRGIGPGMMPQVTAIMLAAFGLVLVVQSFISTGLRLGAWAWRGLFFVLGAVILFAATIRGIDLFGVKVPPLGLLVAGPLAVLVSALADRETRPVEVLIYAAVITAFCVGLFKYALRLPIPLAPWWLGY